MPPKKKLNPEPPAPKMLTQIDGTIQEEPEQSRSTTPKPGKKSMKRPSKDIKHKPKPRSNSEEGTKRTQLQPTFQAENQETHITRRTSVTPDLPRSRLASKRGSSAHVWGLGSRGSTHGGRDSFHTSPIRKTPRASISGGRQDEPLNVEEIDSLDEIQRTFDDVVREFRGDKAAQVLLAEYEKLYDALRTTHKSVKSWQLKCHTLSKDIKNNSEKVNMAMHLSQEDKAIIASLNKQVSDAWEMTNEMHERERKAQVAVERMQDEIYVLTKLVEDGIGVDALLNIDDKTKAELQAMEKKMTDIRGEQAEGERMYDKVITRLKHEITEEQQRVKNLTIHKEDLQRQIEENKDHIQDQDQKLFRAERLKIRLKSEMTKFQAEIQVGKQLLKKKEKSLADEKAENERLLAMFRKTKTELNKKIKENNDITLAMNRTQTKNVHLQTEFGNLKNEMKSTQMLMDAKNADIKTLEGKTKTATDALRAQTTKREKCNKELMATAELLKNELGDNDILTKLLGRAENDSQRLVRNMDSIISNMENCKGRYKKLDDKNQLLQQKILSSVAETDRLNVDLLRSKELIKQLIIILKDAMSEKDRMYKSMNTLLNNMHTLENDYHTEETMVMILRKAINNLEGEVKLEQTKKVLAINERDTLDGLCKKMEMENSDLTAENVNLIKQTKTMSINLETSEAVVDRLNDKIEKLRKELNIMYTVVVEKKMENKKLRIELGCLELELGKASQRIHQQEASISQQALSINALTCQRNVLGATCVRNNEHIDMLKEKNGILTDLFKTGAKLYDRRMEEIKFLSLNNMNIWRQKDVIMKKVQSIDSLKSKLGLANQQLVDYKARVKALEDQPPMKVHKYVHMKAQDLTNYELMLKTQHLVKKLIDKTDEVTRLEAALVERSQICRHFKDMLARNPGPELTKKALEDRKAKEAANRKLKVALAESNMREWEMQDTNEELESLKRKLHGERRKTICLRRTVERKNLLEAEARRRAASDMPIRSTLPDIRQGQLPSMSIREPSLLASGKEL